MHPMEMQQRRAYSPWRFFWKTFLITFLTGAVAVSSAVATAEAAPGLVTAIGEHLPGPHQGRKSTEGSQTERLVTEARAVCKLLMETDQTSVCDQLPVEVQQLPEGTPAVTVLKFRISTDEVWAEKVLVDPSVLTEHQQTRRYYLTHERAHVKIARLAGSNSKLKQVNADADTFFGQRVKNLPEGRGGELLADCMAWDSGTWKGVTPAYAAGLGVTDAQGMDDLCRDWRRILLP